MIGEGEVGSDRVEVGVEVGVGVGVEVAVEVAVADAVRARARVPGPVLDTLPPPS